ncbi:MAG TPA: dephospho-CoA kinase [Methyloceanibacter sp.]|nr:dephospho-CoA kinase [Methyloceanibacter sp.]
MLVIGLTGSIGMGKSTAAKHFAKRGIAVFDADAEVHRLYEGEAVPAIAASFPNVVVGNRVDRSLLAQELAVSPDKLRVLEAIVHPMVVKAELDFLRDQEAKGAKFAVLEIPLLFETGAEKRLDFSVVVSASEEVQRARVLARPGMSGEKLDQLLKRQLSDREKRARADYVVDSGGSIADMEAEIDRLLESLKGKQGQVMERLRRGDFN